MAIIFKPPRTDSCSTCDLLSAQIKGNPENRQDLVNRLSLHHMKAEKAIKMVQQDHKNSQLPESSICTCSMDLQQVLLLPTLTHSRCITYASSLTITLKYILVILMHVL
ncbi:hypothetical protein NQ314_002713 [Rhamnusium bicolor]|uniref:Uncharacterized protein n=1 Tax=Rhamnusium bicolor TaxID=1586634 RepID=A0AAV8ZP72_9CUCU|nr:hypothetical protein NQ314_002713 [Rhamnusium bicolor]